MDLWFFDGRIQDADLGYIEDFSSRQTVFVVDDYAGREKGVWNVAKLRRHTGIAKLIARHELILPPPCVLDLPSTTTIAVLAPEAA